MTTISSHVYLVDAPPRMPEMTSCALLPASHHTDTLFKEQLKVLMWIVLILVPLLLDKAFNSAKNSSIGLRSGEYGGKYKSLTPASAHICSIRSVW
jgi:hypothetical protein